MAFVFIVTSVRLARLIGLIVVMIVVIVLIGLFSSSVGESCLLSLLSGGINWI